MPHSTLVKEYRHARNMPELLSSVMWSMWIRNKSTSISKSKYRCWKSVQVHWFPRAPRRWSWARVGERYSAVGSELFPRESLGWERGSPIPMKRWDWKVEFYTTSGAWRKADKYLSGKEAKTIVKSLREQRYCAKLFKLWYLLRVWTSFMVVHFNSESHLVTAQEAAWKPQTALLEHSCW